jgi:alkylation response protein AidB-like acyl-CoA dehydrogenase
MDFALTDEQTLLRDSVSRYLDKKYDFAACGTVVERHGGFSREQWSAFAGMGWLGAGLPEAAGGFGGSAIESAIVLEELGRALVVEPYVALAVLAPRTLLQASDAAARASLAESIAGTSVIAVAHGEERARGRLAHVTSAAKRAARGGYVIDGCKSRVLGGPVADRFIVSARTSGSADDARGITLFALHANAPGMRRHDYRLIDGSVACDLVFERVEAGPDDVLGEAGGAFRVLEHAHFHAIAGACAEALGVMERATWTTRDYLQQRRQFGVPIASFQALQHRLADMVIALEQSRAMLHCALSALECERDDERRHAVAAAKAKIGHAGRFVAGQAIQLHGGIGITDEYVIGHCLKRLIVIDSCFGNAQLHLGEIARSYSRTNISPPRQQERIHERHAHDYESGTI